MKAKDSYITSEDKLLNHILERYQRGHAISAISEDLSYSNDFVLSLLREFKEFQRVNKIKYNERIKQVIANRNLGGISGESIIKELNVSRTIIKNSISEYGYDYVPTSSESPLLEINKEFKQGCPICGSKKYSDVDTIIDKEPIIAKFCMDCNNEII